MHSVDDLGAATWIDLLAPTPEEVERVRQATGLRVPGESEIGEIESSSRLAFESGAYYLSTPLVMHKDDGDLEVTAVGFVFSPRVLVTVRFAGLPSFDAAHEAVRAQPATQDKAGAEGAFLRILEVVVDRAADGLERAGSDCDKLAHAAFRPRDLAGATLRATLSRVGSVANVTSHLRDALLGVGRIVAFVTDAGFEGAPRPNESRLKAIRADIASLTDYEAHLSSKVQFLLDATLGFINVEQNDIVRTLTIASVAGIPPVLVVGIYGMNFHVMPELNWPLGYPMAIALVVVSTAIPLVWFKRRGWM